MNTATANTRGLCKAAVYLIAAGIFPDRSGASLVVRELLHRAIEQAPIIDLVTEIIDASLDSRVKERAATILEVVRMEEERYTHIAMAAEKVRALDAQRESLVARDKLASAGFTLHSGEHNGQLPTFTDPAGPVITSLENGRLLASGQARLADAQALAAEQGCSLGKALCQLADKDGGLS